MKWTAALLATMFALFVPKGHGAAPMDDVGQAMVNCQNNPVFNASNSAKQCVDLGKIYDGSCAVGLKAIPKDYISFFPYDCEKKCSTRPEEFGWAGGETSASVNVCERGCMYTSSLDPQGAAGYSYSPTGGTCSTSDAPAPTPAGDGTDPGGGGGETGGGDGGGTNPGGGDGDGGGGTNPGGGDGGGGTGPGDGDGGGDDGGGDDGGGDGGGGTGPGPGPGEGDGDGDGPGTPGEDGGPLYEHDKNLTIPKVYAEFEQRVKKAPIIDATKRFFTVSVGGSCPVFTVPASAYWEAMTFDLHCSGAIFALLQLIGWVLLAMAAYKAGEIALT